MIVPGPREDDKYRRASDHESDRAHVSAVLRAGKAPFTLELYAR